MLLLHILQKLYALHLLRLPGMLHQLHPSHPPRLVRLLGLLGLEPRSAPVSSLLFGVVVLAAVLVIDDLLGHVDLEVVDVDIRVALDHLLAGLLLSGPHLLFVTGLGTLKQRAVALLAAAGGVVKVRIVARFVADIALHVGAAGAGAGHLVAAVVLDKRCAA